SSSTMRAAAEVSEPSPGGSRMLAVSPPEALLALTFAASRSATVRSGTSACTSGTVGGPEHALRARAPTPITDSHSRLKDDFMRLTPVGGGAGGKTESRLGWPIFLTGDIGNLRASCPIRVVTGVKINEFKWLHEMRPDGGTLSGG